MKRTGLLLTAALGVFLSGCNKDIVITASATGASPSVFTPTTVTAHMNRKDTVTFINQEDRVHRIVVGTAAAVLLYPPNSGAGRPNSFVWTIPATTAPPANITWTCSTHTGETGTITVNP